MTKRVGRKGRGGRPSALCQGDDTHLTARLSIRVHYPVDKGRITLYTEDDWTAPVEAVHASEDRQTWTFRFETARPYFYYKPCLEVSGRVYWSRGNNYLAIPDMETIDVYPYYHGSTGGSIGDLIDVSSGGEVCTHMARCYYPPGYYENPLQRFPVLYMHDGQNLFFPYESFLGDDWQVDQTMNMLDAMNIIRRCIVVGVYPKEREKEYTAPGYEEYGRFMVEELKQKTIDRRMRTLPGPENTAVMGSSLGGVVSLYLAWQWPEVFGMAACMSSTFTFRDNLMERIAAEKARDIRIYLDSGWPGDNYEVTRSMRDLLLRRGYEYGRNLMYFAFPEALHSEKYWAMRSHVPFQFFFGEAAASRSVHPHHVTCG
jgi:predicted alpha/beta superfamily hydrolase